MRIGLISDTHIPYHVKELPEKLNQVFHGVDLILHAGDIYIPTVLDQLESIAPVIAAAGDDDYGEILRDERVKQEHVLTFEGVTLWLFHQYEMRSWDGYMRWEVKTWEREEKHPDVIIYGHTHESAMVNGNGVLKITPGSATFPRYKCELGTVGLMTIESGKVDAKIIQLV